MAMEKIRPTINGLAALPWRVLKPLPTSLATVENRRPSASRFRRLLITGGTAFLADETWAIQRDRYETSPVTGRRIVEA